MQNHFLLSPYYIDSPLPSLNPAGSESWDRLPAPDLPPSSQMEHLAALYPGLASWVAGTA